jgi:hypothetical protein
VKLHPRTLPVRVAGNELERLLVTFQAERDLTAVEMLGLLTECQQRTLKYMLRVERHGDADKKADEE